MTERKETKKLRGEKSARSGKVRIRRSEKGLELLQISNSKNRAGEGGGGEKLSSGSLA